MKRIVQTLGDAMTKAGERHGIRWMVYNPVTWARFLVSSRRCGRVFSEAVIELFPRVKSCLDVGSGAGGYVYWLKRKGLAATGVEYSCSGRIISRLQGVKVLSFDCSDEAKRPNFGRVDLAFSIEVAEHLPTDLEEAFVSYIVSQSELVVFSAAHPGQGGQGHINEQPPSHWRKIFRKFGYGFRPDETDRFRAKLLELGFRGWLPTNCQIFRSGSL